MDENSVVFKGSVNALTIVMREEDRFDDILEQVDKKIATAGKFFKGATLNVKYKGKKLSSDEEARLLSLIVAKSGAEIRGLEEDMEDVQIAQKEDVAQNKFRIKNFYFRGIDEGITKFYRGTVRSGQLISFEGNVVVIGDVNPGGVIEAAGNVIVMGTLRGIVHAGADGNREAVVVAFNLQPTQLRIADLITRAPDESEARSSFVPEIAYIKEDMVYIDRYL